MTRPRITSGTTIETVRTASSAVVPEIASATSGIVGVRLARRSGPTFGRLVAFPARVWHSGSDDTLGGRSRTEGRLRAPARVARGRHLPDPVGNHRGRGPVGPGRVRKRRGRADR